MLTTRRRLASISSRLAASASWCACVMISSVRRNSAAEAPNSSSSCCSRCAVGALFLAEFLHALGAPAGPGLELLLNARDFALERLQLFHRRRECGRSGGGSPGFETLRRASAARCGSRSAGPVSQSCRRYCFGFMPRGMACSFWRHCRMRSDSGARSLRSQRRIPGASPPPIHR